MLEFYQAYSDYLELMDMTEELFAGSRKKFPAARRSSTANRRSISDGSRDFRCAKRS